MEFLKIFLYLLLALILISIFVIYQHYNYWQRHNVLYDKPDIFRGNMSQVGSKQTIKQPFYDFYHKYKGKALFGGFYLSFRKAVILLDLDLIKQVLIKDFNYFVSRGNYYNEKDDPLSAHLFNLEGCKWREMRAILTPTFTASKMKLMFPCVVEEAQKLIDLMKELIETQTLENGLEVSDLLARFGIDVIANCAFGLDCNSLREPNSEFRIMGKKYFTKRRYGRFLISLAHMYPNLARFFGISLTLKDVSDFMLNIIKQTVEYREREDVKKQDFLNLLIELKNTQNQEALTIEQIAAQALIFYLGGYETGSNSLGFVLYEMAINQEIQKKARQEINEVMKKYNNKLTYEAVKESKYLQKIVYETLRKYPVGYITTRKAIADYKIPNTPYTIAKDMIVIIPIEAIHHDPEIYPNPEEFKPERFCPEEIKKRHTMSWLPFGAGPRNCIGLKFGEMQMMIGLIMLLGNFHFSLTPQTPVPMEFASTSFVLTPKGGLYIKLEKVKTN